MEIFISKGEIRSEIMVLVSHIADMRGMTSDEFLRTVTGLEGDDAWSEMLCDAGAVRLSSRLSALAGFDVTAEGYGFRFDEREGGGGMRVTPEALKRMLTVFLVASLSRDWMEAAGWPAGGAATEMIEEAVAGVNAAFAPASAPPAVRSRRLPAI